MTAWTVDLTIELRNGRQKVTGTVTPPAESAPDPLEAMHAWLANIDASELQRVALAEMDPSDASFAAAMMAVLRRWASGNP